MKKILFSSVAAVALTLASCATTVPLAVTSNPVGSKIGQASYSYILGFPMGGDAGIYAAAKNGGITKVSTVDVKVTPAGFITTVTTIVSGE